MTGSAARRTNLSVLKIMLGVKRLDLYLMLVLFSSEASGLVFTVLF